ncbi:MAG: restriction endonuclease subunit S, partial [Chloroflexota bacterium]|nr:restriction endonuclease subunit S [Chloroflexota bacterium]
MPAGWAETSLASVASWGSGGTPTATNRSFYGGPIPWAVIGDLTDATVIDTAAQITEMALVQSSAKLVPAGTVLIAMYGSIGKLGIAGVPMATNQAIAFASPHAGVLDRRYLFHYLRSQRHRLNGEGKGATQQNISQTILKAWPIPLAPLPEQERIVAAIEEQFSRLDAGVAALERVRQNLKRMRAAVYEAAVTREMEPSRSDENVSASWPHRSLGDVLESISAGKSFKCDERPAPAGQWGVVKVSAMTWGRFLESENKTVLPSRDIDERLEIRPGDLLISRANTVDYVGAVVLVGNCRPKLLLSDKSLRLEPSPDVLPEWLVVVLRSRTARRYIEAVATGTSDSMRNISQPKLKALRI